MKKIFIFFISILNILALQSSSIVLDNDMFMSDKWYTNGLDFTLDNYFFEEGFNKKETYILGEKIFTPTKYNIEFPNFYDRPFSGLLYFGILKEKYYPEGTYKKEGFLVEMTGKPALADVVQKTYHKLLFFRTPRGWDYQIENIYGLAYVREESKTYKKWDFDNDLSLSYRPVTELHLGNVMLYGKGYLVLNYGRLQNEYEFGEKEAKDKRLFNMNEYYLSFESGITLKGHDSTIEGDIFKNQSPITFDIYPLVLQNRIGMYMRWEKFSFEYDFTMISTEVKNMIWSDPSHRYHSLKFNFYY